MPRWIVTTAWRIFFVLAFAAVFVPPVFAELPPARSPQECAIVGAIAGTARTLDRNGITGDKAAAVMADFYAVLLEGEHGARAAQWIAAALKHAAREDVRGLFGAQLNAQVMRTCHAHEGDLGKVFGVNL